YALRQHLRHVRHHVGVLACRHLQKIAVAEAGRARGSHEPAQRPQHRGLAGAVRPHQRRHLAGTHRRQVHRLEDAAAAVGHAEGIDVERYHHNASRLQTSQTKNGTPMSAVTRPIGTTAPVTIVLLAVEASDRMSAPARALAGSRKRWSSPMSSRPMCGPTRPTKAMVPTNETAVAV